MRDVENDYHPEALEEIGKLADLPRLKCAAWSGRCCGGGDASSQA
jgi:hypothetical protein